MISMEELIALVAVFFLGLSGLVLWSQRIRCLGKHTGVYSLALGATAGAEMLVVSFIQASENHLAYLNLFLGLSFVLFVSFCWPTF